MWTLLLVTCPGSLLSSFGWSIKRPVVLSPFRCVVSGVFSGGSLTPLCMVLMALWTRPLLEAFVTCALPFRPFSRCLVVAALMLVPSLFGGVLMSSKRTCLLSALRSGNVRCRTPLRSSGPGLRTVRTCLLSARQASPLSGGCHASSAASGVGS